MSGWNWTQFAILAALQIFAIAVLLVSMRELIAAATPKVEIEYWWDEGRFEGRVRGHRNLYAQGPTLEHIVNELREAWLLEAGHLEVNSYLIGVPK